LGIGDWAQSPIPNPPSPIPNPHTKRMKYKKYIKLVIFLIKIKSINKIK